MKWIVLGRILLVIGTIPCAIILALWISSLVSDRPIDIHWGLLITGIIICFVGAFIEDKGKRQRKIINGHQQLK